ncbi:hypothetical protein GGF46_003500 [Coemansia sp. RSA 552]|nr:hypothetical protein GGF46_003500 [Coemansia sp. RSA 552]
MHRIALVLLAFLLAVAQVPGSWGLPLLDDDAVPSSSAGTEMVGSTGSSAEPVPQSGSKCSVGCGVGIGVGCLAGIILIGFIFVLARRHRRKLHTLWVQRRWLAATHKKLPDKPMPPPPLPSKF